MTTAPCPERESALLDVLEGRLDTREQEALEAHVLQCTGCQDFLLLGHHVDRLFDDPRLAPMVEDPQPRQHRGRRLAMVAGAIAALLLVGVVWWSGARSRSRPSGDPDALARSLHALQLTPSRLADPAGMATTLDDLLEQAEHLIDTRRAETTTLPRYYVHAVVRRTALAWELLGEEERARRRLDAVQTVAEEEEIDLAGELLVARLNAVRNDPARMDDVAGLDRELEALVAQARAEADRGGRAADRVRNAALMAVLKRVSLHRDYRPDRARAFALLAQAEPIAVRLDHNGQSFYLMAELHTRRLFAESPADYDAMAPALDRLRSVKVLMDEIEKKNRPERAGWRWQEGDFYTTRGGLGYEAYLRFGRTTDLEAAAGDFEQAAALRRTRPLTDETRRGIAWAEHNLGLVELERGNYGAARTRLTAALRLKQDEGRDQFTSITGLGLVALLQDDVAAATQRFESAFAQVSNRSPLAQRIAAHLHLEVVYTLARDARSERHAEALDALLAQAAPSGRMRERVKRFRLRVSGWRANPVAGRVAAALLPLIWAA